MSNNTATILTLTGDAEQIKTFIAKSRSEKATFSFSGLLPIPPELDDSIPAMGMIVEDSQRFLKQYGADNWYDWRIQNWGTKWECYAVGEWSDNQIYYETAWAYATPFFLRVSPWFPDVTFHQKFADECGNFIGWDTIKNGEKIESVRVGWESEQGIKIRKDLGVWDGEYTQDD